MELGKTSTAGWANTALAARSTLRVFAGAIVVALSVIPSVHLAQQSYTFTPAGATGQTGPSQGMVNNAYSSTNLNGLVSATGGIQQFTISQTGAYRIHAIGAQGGNNGGYGAYIAGDFNLAAGTVLKILVGQEGTSGSNGNYSAGGGGGGSYVTDMSNSPYVVAGGGGGNGGGYTGPGLPCCLSGMEASLTQNGKGPPSVGGTSGTSGGGGGCISSLTGGAGAGITGNGSQCQSASSAQSFANGGTGGSPGGGSGQTGTGGFGGGGGGYSSGVGNRGGGGGGYSGGGGGSAVSSESEAAGGGGGSFNGGTNQTNSIVAVGGDGMVIVERLCDVNVFASNNPICEGAAATLSTNAGSNIQWSTGPNTSTISVSPQTTTSYTVSGVSSSTSACSSTLVITVSVNPLPEIRTFAFPPTVCADETATLMASGAVSYTWSTGPFTETVAVSPSGTTIYTVTGESADGCINTQTTLVGVNSNSVSLPTDVQVCAGNSATIIAGGLVTYTWDNGSHFSQLVVTPAVNTIHSVNGIDALGCKLTGTVNVTVFDPPNVSVSASSQSICRGEQVTLTATGADSYQWNTSEITASITQTLYVDVPYSFTVTGTDANGCSSTDVITVDVSVCLGLAEGASSKQLVFPNPSEGVFTFENEAGTPAEFRVSDVTGKIILEGRTDGRFSVIDLSRYDAGIYYLAVESGKGRSTFKLIRR